ncbi:cation:proton antiporter subunit C [Rubripirellula amarantea]|nr:cation:proton antiporter subunit C [Rubripirellula amarantea]
MNWESVIGLYNYWVVVVLMMTGFYMVIARKNLIKSILGLNIFQTSVFLLYITMGKINGATAPIVPAEIAAAASHGGHGEDHAAGHAVDKVAGHASEHGVAGAGEHADEHAGSVISEITDHVLGGSTSYTDMTGIDAEHIVYSNPLPSVLMLTAIVVGIATTALALALIVRVREDYGTIEEDEIMELDRAS